MLGSDGGREERKKRKRKGGGEIEKGERVRNGLKWKVKGLYMGDKRFSFSLENK